MKRLVVGTIITLFLIAANSGSAQAVDLVLLNGDIITLEPDTLRAEAVAVSSGQIVAVGSTAEIERLAEAETRKVDLEGRTAIPGLIDNHVHLLRSASGSVERLGEISQTLASKGVTSIVDVGGFNFTEDLIEPAHILAESGRLAVRILTTYWTGARTPDAAERAIARFASLDVSPTGALVQSVGIGETLYLGLHDRPGAPFAPSMADKATAESMLQAAISLELPMHLHSRTEAGTGLLLDLYAANRRPFGGQRSLLTLHHLENAGAGTIDRIAELGVTAALHPRGSGVAAGSDGRPELRPRVALFERAGVLWGLGSDATSVSAVDMLALIAWASGEAADSKPKWTVLREAALRAATFSNARLMNRENSLGSIKPGKLADLVVLDADLLSSEVQISEVRPVMTIVNGRVVFEAE